MPDVMPIAGLERVQIAGRWTKAFASPLDLSGDVLGTLALRAYPGPWNPQQACDLPFPWAPSYVAKGQEFDPYSFARNCVYLAKLAIDDGEGISPRIGACIGYLGQQLAAYTSGAKVIYTFPHTLMPGFETIPAPWYSANAQALAAIGCIELWRATQVGDWAVKSRIYLSGITLAAADTTLVRLDEASWLWFEETPPAQRTGVDPVARPTGILNGHVSGILAFAHALKVYQTTGTLGDTWSLHVRAGAATAATYYQRTRNPGGIMDYWTFSKVPDYGPVRALNMVTTLGRLTGAPAFQRLRDAFLTDVPVAV